MAQQPLATVLKEEAQAVVGHTYRAAAAAAAYVPIPDIQRSPALEIRVATLEKIVANVTGDNGTIGHILRSLNACNDNIKSSREDIDCRALPGASISIDSVEYVGMNKQQEFH